MYNRKNYSGYGTDDGYDAIKDMNAEMGFYHDSSYGYNEAINRGYLKKDKDDTTENKPNEAQ